jgi:hypothetical protein
MARVLTRELLNGARDRFQAREGRAPEPAELRAEARALATEALREVRDPLAVQLLGRAIDTLAEGRVHA